MEQLGEPAAPTCPPPAEDQSTDPKIIHAASPRIQAKGSLKSKVDQLADQGLIRPHLSKAAHAIRLLGNVAAHGDDVSVRESELDTAANDGQAVFAEAVDERDAKDVLALLRAMLTEVYETQAITTRLMSRRIKLSPSGQPNS